MTTLYVSFSPSANTETGNSDSIMSITSSSDNARLHFDIFSFLLLVYLRFGSHVSCGCVLPELRHAPGLSCSSALSSAAYRGVCGGITRTSGF